MLVAAIAAKNRSMKGVNMNRAIIISLPLRSLSVVAIAMVLMSVAAPLPDAVQREPSNTTRFLAWELGSRLSLAAIGYNEGASLETVKSMIKDVRPVAKFFGAEIPSLPTKTGQFSKDSAEILNYILNTVGDNIGSKIASLYPNDHLCLFEVALKSNILLLIYGPGDDISKAIANVIRERAPSAKIPLHIWRSVVNKIESQASYEEVKEAVVRMHEEVGHLFASKK